MGVIRVNYLQELRTKAAETQKALASLYLTDEVGAHIAGCALQDRQGKDKLGCSRRGTAAAANWLRPHMGMRKGKPVAAQGQTPASPDTPGPHPGPLAV